MTDRPAVSILLPTVKWTKACDQMAEQLQEGDELFVICDTENDPVANHEPREDVEILVAGELKECSGKANAMAHGMEQATNNRFVWTDADFERDKEWLNRLVTAGERHGPATAVPFWYGNGAWSILEPWTAMFSTVLIYYGIGATGNIGWGGGLTFTREELNITVEQLAEELRQVLSDDGLLSQHIDDFHAVKSMVTPVEVPGDVRSTYARLVRFNRLTHVHEGMTGELIVALVVTAAAVGYPFVIAPAVTLLTGGAYAVLGLRRRTFLLSYLGLFFIPLTILGGIFIPEFEWAGRRYRLNGEYDVQVIN